MLQTRLEVQPLVHISTCPASHSNEQQIIANTSLALLAAAQKVPSGGGIDSALSCVLQYVNHAYRNCDSVNLQVIIIGNWSFLSISKTQDALMCMFETPS